MKNRKQLLDENESQYGAEAREKYGSGTVDASYQKVRGMSQAQWEQAQALGEEINRLLEAAFREGDPAGETAQAMCDLHRRWLCLFWPDGLYSHQAHRALGESYAADPRFAAYYDKIAPGAACFLRDALNIYCAEE